MLRISDFIKNDEFELLLLEKTLQFLVPLSIWFYMVIVLCFVVRYFMSILVLQSS